MRSYIPGLDQYYSSQQRMRGQRNFVQKLRNALVSARTSAKILRGRNILISANELFNIPANLWIDLSPDGRTLLARKARFNDDLDCSQALFNVESLGIRESF